jgi:carboxymethylenebutenolidase
MIELQARDGHSFSAYRAEPTDEPKGAIVILHDAFGVDPHIKGIADSFAEQGYVAVAPSLFDRARRGIVLGYDEAGTSEGLHLQSQISPDAIFEDIQTAVDSAGKAGKAGKVAVIGYCWGGYLAYIGANRLAGLACAVGYYGTGVTDEGYGKRRVPTLLHFGENDPLNPSDAVTSFRFAHPDVSAFSYEAGDGFSCEYRESYQEEAATLALERTLDWIAQFIEGPAPAVMKNAGAYAQQKQEKKKKSTPSSDDLGPPAD